MSANTRSKKRERAPMIDVKALEKLDNNTIQAVTDLTNTLREMGLNQELDVPSTVVVGDTSAGKSSVMSRLTGLPFPQGAGVKTTFQTEVIMKRDKDESITFEIFGDGDDATKTLQRPRSIDIDHFPEAFQTATEQLKAKNNSQVIVEGRLRIEMRGPRCPPLTVIDLPGLMHSTNAKVTKADVKMTGKLIKQTLKKSRTLILAVVSANNESVNQAITEMATEADPESRRTMGILTKIDTLNDEDREETMIKTLQNKEIPLSLGWYGLVNVKQGQKNASNDLIDQAETKFFAGPRFKACDKDFLGIDAFRKHVTNVVAHELVDAIPAVEKEAMAILEKSREELKALGEPRSESGQQRAFLLNLSQRFSKIIKSELDALMRMRRSRDKIQGDAADSLLTSVAKLHTDFKEAMDHYASKKTFTGTMDHRDSTGSSNTYKVWADGCEHVLQDDAIAWVNEVQSAASPFAIPARVTDSVFTQLFHELSSRWASLTAMHMQTVKHRCEKTMRLVLQDVAGETGEDVVERIMNVWIRPYLEEQLHTANATITKSYDDMSEIVHSSDSDLGGPAQKYWASAKVLGQDVKTQRVQLDQWTRNIGSQVSSRFLRTLPQAVNSNRVNKSSAEELAILVSEPTKTVEQRLWLTKRIERLEKALKEIGDCRKSIKVER